MLSPEQPFLDQVISPQRFNRGKLHRLNREQAIELGRVAFRSSVPVRLRPVEFAPVEVSWSGGLIRHDELGTLYDCLLTLYARAEDDPRYIFEEGTRRDRMGVSRDLKRQPAAIDVSGFVYKNVLPGDIAVGHEYGYFPDPKDYWKERVAMALLMKGRRQHRWYERSGHMSTKRFLAGSLS